GLRTQIAALDQSRITIPVDFDPDIAGLRTQLAALDRSKVTIPVRFDARDLTRLNALIARLRARTIRIKVQLHGIGQAIRQLTALDAVVRRLDGRRININVDVDSGTAIIQMTGVTAATRAAEAAGGGLGSTFNRGLVGIAQTAAQAVGILVAIPAIAAAIAVAGAAITAAWGAISTAIMAIPGALFLVGAPIAAVMTGLDGIKKAAATIAPEFDKMKAAVSGSFEAVMVPVFKQLATIFPQLTTGMQGTAEAIGVIATRLTEMVTSAAGIQRIDQIFANVNQALREMAPGIAAVVDSLLILGSQKSIFDTLTTAVNEFGTRFRSMVIDVVADGTLDSA